MTKIKLQDARLSFPHLFKAKAFDEGGVAKYQATFMLDSNNKRDLKQITALKAAMDECGREKWGKQWDAGKIKLKGTCLKAQDEELIAEKFVTATQGDDREESEGMYMVSSTEAKRPTVVDSDKTPLTDEDGKPYAGCYVTGIITLWAQDNKFGKRINANLVGVQFKKDGEAFGEGSTSVEDDDWDDDDDMMD